MPAKPAMSDGKQSEAATPSRSMSAARATGVVATGPHLVEARRLHRPLVLRAARHRVQPDLGVTPAVEHPRLGAVLGGHDRGASSAIPGRQPALEEVGGLDEVVVDRDDGQTTRSWLGVGQEGRHRPGACHDP